MENSSHGLTLLDPDHRVVVTGEERYQSVLAGYAPGADGRARRVAVELGFTPVGRAARGALELRLDGQRVGELTELMTRRYGPLVDALLRQGRRPGAVALVVHGRRGRVEVELRLPEAPAGAPAERPAPMPPWPGPAGRRPGRGGGGRRHGRGRGRGRGPYLVGAGVLALLLGVGVAVGGNEQVSMTVGAAAGTPTTVRVVAPTTTPRPTTTLTPPDLAAPAPAGPELDAPEARAVPTPDQKPQRVVVEPAPESEPEPAAAPRPSGDCHPSYNPCVPDGPDLDCPDLDGPYTVSGPDEFRLDADKNGIGCE